MSKTELWHPYFLEVLLAVGGRELNEWDPSHSNAEYFDTDKDEWVKISSFPEDSIFSYVSVFHVDHFYVIGGYINVDVPLNSIKRLDIKNWEWTEAGKLNTARAQHNAIMLQIRCQKLNYVRRLSISVIRSWQLSSFESEGALISYTQHPKKRRPHP